MKHKRRKFLGQMAAGSAVVSMPAFLAGCGVTPAQTVDAAVPANPFMEWFGVDNSSVAQVMAALCAGGAAHADLYFQYRRTNQLMLDEGVIGRVKSDIIQGVGLRVINNGQSGHAYTDDLTLPGMLGAAKKAAAMAAGTPFDAVLAESYAFAPPGNLYVISVPWSDVGVAQKTPILERIDSLARAADPSINNVTINWSDVDEQVMIVTLDGRIVTDRRPLTRLATRVTATRFGEAQSGYANISARDEISWYTDERIDRHVDEAVDRTLILFDAQQPAVGDMPVVLASGTSGILLHEAIGHSLEADFIRNGTSVYANMLGQKVAEPFVTVVDDGTIANERGALNFDDEGNACNRTVMVENGVLKSYLHDVSTAKEFDVRTTGSGRRESYKHTPMPRMTCTFMENGPHTKDEIIAAVDHGIIAETYTSGNVAIGAGDFFFYVKNGWLIEQGKVTAPLRDLQISGNGPETLRRISMLANDTVFDPGGWTCGKNGQQVPVSQAMPTVLVSSMNVAPGKTA